MFTVENRHSLNLMDKTSNAGFTLIELVLVITLTGMLSAMAYPSFAGTIKSIRLSTASNQFLTSLNLARCEAIKRNLPVVLAKKAAATNNWTQGWFIFIDVDGNKIYGGDSNWSVCPKDVQQDCVIASFDALNKDLQLSSVNNDNSQSYISFTNDGSLENGNSASFKLCSIDTAIKEYRTIAINLIGHSLVTKYATAC